MVGASAPAPVSIALPPDGALAVETDERCAALVRGWLPRSACAHSGDPAPRATIRVEACVPGTLPSTPPASAPEARLGSVGLWARDPDTFHLADAAGALHATLAPEERVATVGVDVTHEHASAAVYSALTLCGALLLGRMGRALVHAGAVESPEGGAWLVVGDSRAGKTSTCASLHAAGWRLLADDHIVLRADDACGVVADGWPRAAHLDEGWERGTPTGVRRPVDLFARRPGGHCASAPVAGILFPRVQADQPTIATPAAASDAFGRLVRQSPWLMVDPVAARTIAALLARVASRPAYELRLGRDTFADGPALVTRLPDAVTRQAPAERHAERA